MAPIKTSPAAIRASLMAEIEQATSLSPFIREALLRSFVPFAELFCEQQIHGTPEAGRAVAEATVSVAAAIIGHLHLNVSRPGIDKAVAIRDFMGVVERKVFAALAADDVMPSDGGRWQ